MNRREFIVGLLVGLLMLAAQPPRKPKPKPPPPPQPGPGTNTIS